MLNPCVNRLLIVFVILIATNSVSLRMSAERHDQIGTFANVINDQNYISLQNTPGQTATSTPPKVGTGIIIAVICIVLCFLCCFFTFKCARNQQNQAQSSLQQTIPCYCGPCKFICRCCKYLLCIDIVLRCLGVKSTNWQKQQRQRLAFQEQQKKKQEKLKRKQDKKLGRQQNPYETVMKRQEVQPVNNWKEVPPSIPNMSIMSDRDRVKSQTCQICMGKVKGPANIMTNCSGHCVFHLQCLIQHKNNNKKTQNVKVCPHCKSNYFNTVRFYCQKCWNRYNEMMIESGNIYASQLDFKEALKSIGGERCDECVAKKWFWQ